MSTDATASVPCDIQDLALSAEGKPRVEWAFGSMPVLQSIRKQFIREQPFAGVNVSARLPVTTATAGLLTTLRDGGASVAVCAPQNAVVDDEVAACLVRDYGISVYAVSGESAAAAAERLEKAASHSPRMVIDQGSDLILKTGAAGVSADTRRLRSAGAPAAVVALDGSSLKRLFDGRYGAGQSTFDAISRMTTILIAGSNVAVAGYGPCGRGIAVRAAGLGARVTVAEVDPVRALEAAMDGYRVAPLNEALAGANLVVASTGCRNVISREQVDRLADGAIVCAAGTCLAEIDVPAIERAANSRREVRAAVEEFKMKDGRRVYLLAGGGPVNVAAGGGQPAPVADLGCATQALAAEYLLAQGGALGPGVHALPGSIDRQIARIKLASMAISIDKLTIEQEQYLAGWAEGK